MRAWGKNFFGQLGDGTTTDRWTPVPVSGLTDVIAVAAGRTHSLALTSTGTVYAFGTNTYGQLGDGTTTIRKTPIPVPGLANIVRIAAGHDHSLALAADGTVWAWGRNAQGQIGDGTTTDRWAPVAISGPGLTWRAPTPVISLPAGTYAANQSTTVTSTQVN